MPNLSSLAAGTTAVTALSNLIVASPQATIGYQPQNVPGAATAQLPPPLLFHYEGEQTALLESDITDHYIEDNTAIQDNIALRPEVITTHGFIGELTDTPPTGTGVIQTLADKLTALSAYTPQLTLTALIAYNEAFQLYQVAANALNSGVSIVNSLSGQGGESVINGQGITLQANQNKQQAMFQQFYGYWRNRTPFTVQTPWAVFQNMYIKSFRAIQDASTNVITDFEVSFKLIRTATTSTGLVTSVQGALNTESAGATDLGNSSPQPSIDATTGIANNYPGSFSSLPSEAA